MQIHFRKIMPQLRAAACCALFVSPCFAGSAHAAPAFAPQEIDELRELAKSLADKQAEEKDTLKNLEVKKAEMDRIRKDLARLKNEVDTKRDALDKIQRFDMANPDLGLGSKVQEARLEYKNEFDKLENLEKRKKDLEAEMVAINTSHQKINTEVKHRNMDYLAAQNKVVDRVLEQRVKELKVSRQVTAEAVVACGEESVSTCRERAKKQAERNASESGSVVLVQSMTQIQNFKLTEEKVRSEVSARLSNIEILEKGWKGDESYRVKISAMVTPSITGTLRNEVKETVQSELAAVVGGYAPVDGFDSPAAPAVAGSSVNSQPTKPSSARQAELFNELENQDSTNMLSQDQSLEEVEQEMANIAKQRKPVEVKKTESRSTKPSENTSTRRRLVGGF